MAGQGKAGHACWAGRQRAPTPRPCSRPCSWRPASGPTLGPTPPQHISRWQRRPQASHGQLFQQGGCAPWVGCLANRTCVAHLQGGSGAAHRQAGCSCRSLFGRAQHHAGIPVGSEAVAVQRVPQGGRRVQRLCRSGLKATPDQCMLQMSSSGGSAWQLQAAPQPASSPSSPSSPDHLRAKTSSIFNEFHRMQAPKFT